MRFKMDLNDTYYEGTILIFLKTLKWCLSILSNVYKDNGQWYVIEPIVKSKNITTTTSTVISSTAALKSNAPSNLIFYILVPMVLVVIGFGLFFFIKTMKSKPKSIPNEIIKMEDIHIENIYETVKY